MKRIKIWDKEFEISINYSDIQHSIREIANKMKVDLEGKETLFICVLNGAYMFAAELMKEVELHDSEISFLKLASYSGISSTGEIKELIGFNEVIAGRNIVILEDIVDSGRTVKLVCEQLMNKGAFPVTRPLFLHMFQNLATNGDAHYDFNEFQPWVPIAQKTTSYFTYYLWGSGGKWQNSLQELRDRNLITVH